MATRDYLMQCMISLLPPGADIIITSDSNVDLSSPYSSTLPNKQGKIFYQYLTHWDFVSTRLHFHSSLSMHTYESWARSIINHIFCPHHILPRFLSLALAEIPVCLFHGEPHLRPSPGAGHPLSSPPYSSYFKPLLFQPPSHPNWHGISKEDIHRLYTMLSNIPLASLIHELMQSLTVINFAHIDDHLFSLTRITLWEQIVCFPLFSWLE